MSIQRDIQYSEMPVIIVVKRNVSRVFPLLRDMPSHCKSLTRLKN
jgi:hypothetical protein